MCGVRIRTMTRRCLLLAAGTFAGAVASATLWSVRAFQSKSPGPRRLVKSPAAPPRNDRWRVIGPGGGGAMFRPTVSPHDENLVIVACDMSGAYLSEDGGALWRMINFREQPRFTVFDPVDPAVIYIGVTGCLYRSQDRGRTWHLILPAPSAVRLTFYQDEADISITDAEHFGRVSALAIDPADSKSLYVAVGKTIRRSTDRGRRFSDFASVESDCLGLFIDPHSPPRQRVLFAAGKNWVAACRNGKWTGAAPIPFRSGFRTTSISFPAGGSPVIYGLTPFEAAGERWNGGVLVSRDEGASWEPLGDNFMRAADPGSKAPLVHALAASPSDSSVVYVSYDDLVISGQHYQGVARTTDGGKTWAPVLANTRDFAANISEAWFPDRFEADWPENPQFMTVSPRNPDVCYGTDYGRTIRTTDGGKTWQQLYAQCLEDGTYATTGLDVTTTYGVHFDPSNRDRMFISFTDIGLFRSENRGKSWRPSSFGCPREWRNTTYWVEFDPVTPGLMWAAMSGTHDLPRAKMCCDFSKHRGGVCISRDGGKNWAASNAGMPQIAATYVLLDPDSAPRARVLYATAFGRGVYKSSDGGATWTLKNQGIETADPLAWTMARDRNGALYLVTSRRRNAEYGSAGDGALYRSTDGAERWVRIPLPKGVNGPNGIAIDPQNPLRLYLACWGRHGGSGMTGGGIFVSEDGGAGWRTVFSADQHVFDVTVDPANPSILYAGGHECSVWRSGDRGGHWSRVRGFNFKAAQRVVPDPNDPAMIYVTTFGGSVWHGPGEGDPAAAEDIVTPEIAFTLPGRLVPAGRL